MILGLKTLIRQHGKGIVVMTLAFVSGFAGGLAIGPIAHGATNGQSPMPPAYLNSRPALNAARGGHVTEIIRVIDGDTFEARVHVWPGLDITTKVRLRGVDAPEMKARCGAEYAKAHSARDALSRILGEGDVRIANIGLDKYGGRVLADAATRGTVDVSRKLLDSGLARSYSGGRRNGWCD